MIVYSRSHQNFSDNPLVNKITDVISAGYSYSCYYEVIKFNNELDIFLYTRKDGICVFSVFHPDKPK